jgi:hypothetical protein
MSPQGSILLYFGSRQSREIGRFMRSSGQSHFQIMKAMQIECPVCWAKPGECCCAINGKAMPESTNQPATPA